MSIIQEPTTYTPVFTAVDSGIYPDESYVIRPIDFTGKPLPQYFTSANWSLLDGRGAGQINPSLITRSYLNYHRNPLCKVVDYSDVNFNNIIYYGPNPPADPTYVRFSDKYPIVLDQKVNVGQNIYIERVPTIRFFNDSSLTVNTSYLRKTYKSPYSFYFYYVQLDDVTKYSYGYLLYPSKVFLKPISLTNLNNRWQLTTELQYVKSSIYHLASNTIEIDAYKHHTTRLKTAPSTDYIYNISGMPTNNVVFSLSSVQMCVDKPFLTFATPLNPVSYASTNLNATILEDSTFISYNANFTDTSKQVNKILQSPRYLSNIFNGQCFTPTFIVKQDRSTKKQTFQMLQAPLYLNYDFSDTLNCVLSSTITLGSGLIEYSDKYTAANIQYPNQDYIGVDYIGENYKFSNGTFVDTTLSSKSIYVDGIPFSLNSNFLISTITDGNIVWDTVYPPYNYTYKTTVLDASNNYLDSNNLNFYLKLSTVKQTSDTVNLSSYISSDFDLLSVPINDNDLISYKIIDSYPIAVSALSASLACRTYNETVSVGYNIGTSPFVQASYSKNLEIVFTNANFQGVTFSVKATLSSSSGQLDSYQTADIVFATPSIIKGNNIITNILNEGSNFIQTDASYNITASGWPSRDLTNSQILWTYDTGGLNLPVRFFYTDIDGNYIAPVNGPTTFGSNTWYVKLTGYGPNQVTVKLSSQKYSETAIVSSHPNLFNFLEQGSLVVGPVGKLDNLPQTRTITLTAAIPYGNQIYYIPKNIPINWTWQYDVITEPSLQPIQVTQILNDNLPYTYGLNTKASLLSSMKFEITPGISRTTPRIHNVKLIANIDTVQPPISGVYTVKVDDFPDSSLFNADFKTFYKTFSANGNFIGDTRTSNNIITRPNDGLNKDFTVIANSDNIPNIKNSKLSWTRDGVNLNQNFTNSLNVSASPLTVRTINGLIVSSFKIGLNVLSGIAPGWLSAHSCSSETTFYFIDPIEFYNPLKFIIYPEFAWLPVNRSGIDQLGNQYTYTDLSKVTLLNGDNFTASFRPSAFNNKRSNSQTWWLSANKTYFEEYVYQNQDNFSIVSTTTAYDLLDIPYENGSIANYLGIPITLFAQNSTFYPQSLSSSYLIQVTKDGLSGQPIYETSDTPTLTSYLVSQFYYQLTASTITVEPSSDNVYNNFFISPILLDYQSVIVNYNFYSIYNDIVNETSRIDPIVDLEAINVDEDKNIYAVYFVDTYPFSNIPSQVVDGTITFYLSTAYWTASSSASNIKSGLSGTQLLFKLNYGDPSVPLNFGEFGLDICKLYTKVDLYQQIQPSTFSEYPNYPNPDLWNVIEISDQ